MKPKKELVRVVRAPVKEDENGVQTGGEVSLDLSLIHISEPTRPY